MKRGLKYFQHKDGRTQKVRIRRLSHASPEIPHGPGSLQGSVDAYRAARANDYKTAVELADLDRNQAGSDWHCVPKWIVSAWRDFALQNASEVPK